MGLSSVNSSSSTAALTGLEGAQRKQQDAIKKLVSGLRINSAADDAAGLSISTQLQAQLRGLNAASSNGQNAVSLLQTADGGLDQTTQQLQRVRDLTVQAAGTDDPGALSAIGQEITQSLSEVDRISQTTSFGTQSLLDGSLSSGTRFQIGAAGTPSDQFNVAIPGASHASLGLSGLVASVTSGSASHSLSAIDDAIRNVGSTRTDLGAAQNALGNAVNALGTEMLNAAGADSRIMDTDFAESIVNSTLAGLQGQASASVLLQANNAAKNTLALLH